MTSTTLVVLSLEAWDGTWRRNQYLIDGLLRSDPELRVLFVEPARDPLHDLLSRRRVRRGAGRRVAEGYEGRLALLEPTKWLPRMAGAAADRMLRRSVARALRDGDGTGDVLLWVNDPGWAHLVAATDRPSLYDMTDDWLAADRSARAHDRVAANEEVLLTRCAAVVVCSRALHDSRVERRPDVVLISNAVDVERYRRPQHRPDDLPASPTAVYVGTLHEDRLDVATVIRTAQALLERGGRCVLVGPDSLSEQNSAALLATRGVLMLGPRDHTAIPGYLQHADALLVPHVVTAFTDSLDPIKLYEYLAVGRPIVSTPVAGFRDLDGTDGVTVVDAEGFPAAVVAAVDAPPAEGGPAAVPDWADRVRAMQDVLGRLRGR